MFLFCTVYNTNASTISFTQQHSRADIDWKIYENYVVYTKKLSIICIRARMENYTTTNTQNFHWTTAASELSVHIRMSFAASDMKLLNVLNYPLTRASHSNCMCRALKSNCQNVETFLPKLENVTRDISICV